MAKDKVLIRFEGNTLNCRPDTTVAVALWENGVRHLSASPKYGRPRGVTCARGHCTACLMRVDGLPNVRTCELPVRQGMEIQRQDAGAIYAAPMQMMLSAGHAFFPVGFYYKWFTRPPFLSRFFLNRIRPLTGVGRLPSEGSSLKVLADAPAKSDPGAVPNADLKRFDTVIIGAGPAGLEAACRSEGRVLLVDDHREPGGQRYGPLRYLASQPSSAFSLFPILESTLEKIESARESVSRKEGVTFIGATKAIAGYQPDGLVLRRGDHLQTVRFGTLIWTAGALDTLGLFPGNDTPGLLGPRALYRLLIRDGLVIADRHVLVIGGGFDFWLCASLLDAAGARVSLVLTDGDSVAEVSSALDRKWPLNTGLKLDTISAQGAEHLRATFSSHSGGTNPTDSHLVLDGDLAVICRRGQPAYDIPYQLGADLSLQPDRGGFTSTTTDGSLVFAGEAAGRLPELATTAPAEGKIDER